MKTNKKCYIEKYAAQKHRQRIIKKGINREDNYIERKK